MKRKTAQDLHENCSIEDFLKIHYPGFTIFEKPEPPDALAGDGDKIIWLEHCDTYRSSDEAKELWIYVTTGKTDLGIHSLTSTRPDFGINLPILNSLLQKLSKKSYLPAFKKYGPGILIISLQDSLFTEESLPLLKEDFQDFYQTRIWKKFNDEKCFSEAFLRYQKNWDPNRSFIKIYPNFL